MKALRRSVLLLCAIATVVASGAVAGATPLRAARQACGPDAAADWLCKDSGVVTVQAPGGERTSASKRAATRVPSGTTVRARPQSVAKMRFGRDAACQLGPDRSPTDIVTRAGSSTPLFLQRQGQSYCTFRSGATLSFSCGTYSECPVGVTTVGRTRAFVHTSNPVIVDLCAGSVRIRQEDGHGGYAEVIHESSDFGRVRIKLEQTATSVSVEVDSYSAPGICDDFPAPPL